MGYSKFERQTWHDEKVRRWTRDRRELWHYLCTSPHMDVSGSRIGCYVLDAMYAAADLSTVDNRWSPEQVEEEIAALQKIGRVLYDPETRLLLLRRYFKFNHPENPNVAKRAAADVAQLPFSETLLKGLREALLEYTKLTTEKKEPFCSVILDTIDERLQKEGNRVLTSNGLKPSERVTQTLPEGVETPLANPSRSRSRSRSRNRNRNQQTDAVATATGAADAAADVDKSEPKGGANTFLRRLMPVLREAGFHADDTDGSILKAIAKRGTVSQDDVEYAVRGLAALRDAGQLVDVLGVDRGEKLNLRILYAENGPRAGPQPIWNVAQQHYLKELQKEKAKPGMSSLADILKASGG